MTFVARAIVWLRWPIALAWAGGAIAALVLLPSITEVRGGAVGTFVPEDAPALKAEEAAAERFALPAISRELIVQRDRDGLSAEERLAVGRRAVALTRGREGGVAAAVPVIPGLGRPGPDRLALTYLLFPAELDAFERAEAARRIARRIAAAEPDMLVRATGTTLGQAEQADVVVDRLLWVELATALLVSLIVGVRFRSVGAPLLTLGAVLAAYVVSTRLLAELAPQLDVTVPREVQPVIVVLVFGVVTDYSVFYLARARARLAEGDDPLEAARSASALLTGIVSFAALAVAAAAATLLLARLDFLSAFGPGMAIAVLVAAVTAVTLVPALIAIGGRRVFWPRAPERPADVEGPRMRGWTTRFAARHPFVAALLAVLLLLGGATGLWFTELSNPLLRGLSSGSEPHEGYRMVAAEAGPGLVAPTAILVYGSGLDDRRAELARLGELLAAQPGVADVLGAGDQPLDRPLGLALARDGDSARYLVTLSSDPLSAASIDRLGALERGLPELVDEAGLGSAGVAVAGDTALAKETIDRTVSDLARVGPAAVGAVFLVLVLYLRALVAPLAIVLASVLGLAATLGIATWFFQELLGQDGLVFYVPFATAVLLLALGADYSVFLAGRVWRAAKVRGLADAVRVAGTQAAGPITTAAVVLAASFALLALVPVRPFQQVAFTMAVGLLVDGFVVRTLLVPALLVMGADDRGELGRSPA